MGRQLFRALVANGFFRSSAKTEESEQAPRRQMLLERLEDRLLFDAGPVAPMDVDAELTQQAQAAAEAMPLEGSVLEPAEVRVIETLDQIEDSLADLLGQPLDGGSSLTLEPNLDHDERTGETSLLNSDELARQLLLTADELRSELQFATTDVRGQSLLGDPSLGDTVFTRREIAFVDTALVGHEQLVDDLLVSRDPSREGGSR